jgi:hypothetical protein
MSQQSRNSFSGQKPDSRNKSRKLNKNQANKNQQSKSFNDKLAEEFKPPFILNYKWKSSERIKIKLQNPYVENEKETFLFPVCSSEIKFADRALFYKEYLDLQEQAEFGADNVPYLYHLFKRCLNGQSLADWNTITSGRNRENMTLDTYSDDIDRFIKYHDSRDNEDLIQAQVSYMSKLHKPLKSSQSEFRNQLLELNHLLASIPDASDDDQLNNTQLKYLLVESMPTNWKRDFRKTGRKIRELSIDELAQQYFDIHHEQDPPSSDNNSNNNCNNNNNNNPSSNSNRNGSKLKADDPCPLYNGSHKWNECFDNKNGPNFRPPRSNPRRNNGDNHHQDQRSSDGGNNQGSNGNSNPEPSSDPNPYDNNYNAEPVIRQDQGPELVPMICLEAKQDSSKFYFSKVLLDSGGSRTSIARSSIPSSCKIYRKKDPYIAFTSAGLTNHHEEFVRFDQVFLPEFTRTH